MRNDGNGNFIIRKNCSRLTVFLIAMAPVAAADLMACAPTVTINSPLDDAELSAGEGTASTCSGGGGWR